MKNDWTPGPWAAHLNAPLAAIPGHIIKTEDDPNTPVALVWEGGGSHGKPTQIANAHLISAAPDLYEALKEFLDVWESGDANDNSKRAGARRGKMLDASRAAIAKAEGK